jgi:hypothetical protein
VVSYNLEDSELVVMQNNEQNIAPEHRSGYSAGEVDRRDLVQKLGKFALYAAPFTVLAHTHRAEAASGGGPRKTPFPHP